MAKNIKIDFRDGEPMVHNLTRREAQAVARHAMIEHQRAARQVQGLASLVVSLMHRDASRGLVGADGRPVLPLVAEVPAAHARAGHAPTWELEVTPQPDGSLVVRAHDRSPAPALVEAPPGEAAHVPGSVTP